jgi:hypothetical protein
MRGRLCLGEVGPSTEMEHHPPFARQSWARYLRCARSALAALIDAKAGISAYGCD